MAGAALALSLAIYLALVEVLRRVEEPCRGFVGDIDARPLRYAAYGTAAVVILLLLLLRPRLIRRRPADDTPAALRRLQSASLVMLVLGEIPAVAGLALFLVAGQNIDFYKLLFASLLLTFINFPRRVAWEEWLKG
jgi:hypothetical protein